MTLCRILNFKKFDFIFMVKKYSVGCFVPSPLRVLYGERFFSPYGKNLSPSGKFNDIDAKHEQKSAILPVGELANDKLFILWLENLPHGEKNLSLCSRVQ
jgi:hypothetical protein